MPKGSLRRTIDKAEARRLVLAHRGPAKLQREIVRLLGAEERIELLSGPAKIAGDLAIGPSALLVDGDLTVTGCLEDGHAADQTLLVVLGNLSARSLLTLSEIAVTGHVRVKDLVYGNSMGDNRLSVGGDLTAAIIVGDGHWFVIEGRRKGIAIAVDTTASLKDAEYVDEEPRRLFVAQVMDGEHLDLPRVARRIRAGKSIVKQPLPPPAPIAAAQLAKAALDKGGKTGGKTGTKTGPKTGPKKGGGTKLRLVGKRLRTIPPAVLRAADLGSLNLEDNEIRALPADVRRLTSLRVLNLYGNELSGLPKEIGALERLEELNLEFNRLGSLPIEIGRLVHLRTLNVANNCSLKNKSTNYLRRLPDELGNLTALQALDVSMNRLERLPATLARLTALRDVRLSSNCWKRFPALLAELPKLTRLSYGQPVPGEGPIDPEVFDGLTDLVGLTRLDLDRCRLAALPGGLRRLKNLTCLDLAYNRLRRLPDWLGDLASLETLGLGGFDPADETPAQTGRRLRALPNLKKVAISGVDLERRNAITRALPSLEIVADVD